MSSQSVAFDLFCSVYDEFESQSKGRAVVSRGMEFYDLALTEPSPQVLVDYVRLWLEEFSKSPEFHFYRGNFFWRVFVNGDQLCAELIRKNSQGGSPLGKILTWPVVSANPARVVKNLLDIMRNHENRLQKKKKELAKEKLG